MSSERVHLGQFVLDLGRYELTRVGKPVRVERIPMDLLILLVRESGRLVSRAVRNSVSTTCSKVACGARRTACASRRS
jgi:hypothetical protein